MHRATRYRNHLSWLVLLLLAACLALPAAALAAEHGKAAKPAKAILLVAFGTSYEQARQASYQPMEQAVKARFPGVEVRWAFTSSLLRKKMNAQGYKALSPAQALANLAEDGFNQVAIQSLHVIPGEEYEGLQETAQRMAGLPKGLQKIELGKPLLASVPDMLETADILLSVAPEERKPGEALVFMGHGTPHFANAAYPAMAYILHMKDPKAFLATVEGYPDLETLSKELKAAGIKKAYLIPLMGVSGDHAHNDMAGKEDGSWKTTLEAQGITCVPVLKGLAEYPPIVNKWVDHLAAAMAKLDQE